MHTKPKVLRGTAAMDHSAVDDSEVERSAGVSDVLRNALDHLPVAVMVIRPWQDNGEMGTGATVEYVNPRAARLLNASVGQSMLADDIRFEVSRQLMRRAWVTQGPIAQAVDFESLSGRLLYLNVTLERIGDLLMITLLDRTDELAASREADRSHQRRRELFQNLTQPVLVCSPVFLDGVVAELVVIDANHVALEQNPTLSPGRGVVASGSFVAPELALDAATKAWSGGVHRYEVVRGHVLDAGGVRLHEVETFRLGDDIVQVGLDRTGEQELRQLADQLQMTVDLMAQPMHLHTPLFDETGQLVDTRVEFANSVAELLDPRPEPHRGRKSSEIWPSDPEVNLVLDLYRAAWFDPRGDVHELVLDNTAQPVPGRVAAHLQIQARRVGDHLLTVAIDRTELELARRALEARTQQLTTMFDSMSDGIIVISADGVIESVNAAAAKMAGRADPASMVGSQVADIGYKWHRIDGTKVTPQRLGEILRTGDRPVQQLVELERPDGSRHRHMFSTRELPNGDGSASVMVIASDVTHLHEALERSAAAEEQFRTSVDAITDPVLLLGGEGADTAVVYVNAAGLGVFGLTEAINSPRSLSELTLDSETAATLSSGSEFSHGVSMSTPDGATFDVAVSYAGERRIAVFRNVSRLRAEASLLERLARHDPVSGLPNRRGLDLHLGQKLGDLLLHRRSLTVMVFEVDQVEAVQRSYGFATADRVMSEVQRRLKMATKRYASVAGAEPFLAQLTGTSFALVIDAADRGAMTEFADSVAASMARPVMVDRVGLHVEVSAGLAFTPMHGRDADTLVMRAKSAAWTARRRHAASFVWQPAVDDGPVARVELLAEVDAALSNDELFVEYQPQIDLATGNVVGAEALVRWNHPTIGRMPPARFVAEVEESTLAPRFTSWILRRALEEWMNAGPPPGLRVAVNLPPTLAGDPALIPMVEDALIATGASPSMLELEITERGLVAPGPVVLENLGALHALGVKFGIDDFGTGQASLLYLRRLPVQAVKIDRTFMMHLERDKVNRAIVSACVGVAESLGIDVVAEGLENQLEVSAALELGCGFGQGFHIAAPMSMVEFAAFLDENSATTGRSNVRSLPGHDARTG